MLCHQDRCWPTPAVSEASYNTPAMKKGRRKPSGVISGCIVTEMQCRQGGVEHTSDGDEMQNDQTSALCGDYRSHLEACFKTHLMTRLQTQLRDLS